jgi:hypothetical protein
MTDPAARAAPAAVSAGQAIKRTAAVSSRRAMPTFFGVSTVADPAPGLYVGQVDGPRRQQVSFRYLGGGIRDLLIDGEPVADWIPVVAGGVVAEIGDAEVKAIWSDDRQLDGWIRRRRGTGIEVLRFHARHRFRDVSL